MEKSVKKRVEWYNDASIITTGLIGLIIVTILLSQSFAIKNGLGAVEILSSILTHNSIYLCVCLYFIALKTKFGKRYFVYLENTCCTVLVPLRAVLPFLHLGGVVGYS